VKLRDESRYVLAFLISFDEEEEVEVRVGAGWRVIHMRDGRWWKYQKGVKPATKPTGAGS